MTFKRCRKHFILLLLLSPLQVVLGQQTDTDSTAIKNLLNEAEQDIMVGEMQSAREKIARAENQAMESGYQIGVELAQLRFGDLYLNIQFFDSAKTVLENAIDDYPDSRYMRNYLNLLGTTYRYLNENEKAIQTFERALSILDSVKDQKAIVGVNQNMAAVYQSMGMKAEALERYIKAVDFSESVGDTAVLVVALNSLGNALNSYEDYEQATYHIERSLTLARQHNYRVDELRALTNLAISKLSLDNPGEALSLYEEALELSKEIRPNTPPFQILFNIGNVYLKLEDAEKATTYFEESLGYCEQFDIPEGIFYNVIGLGNAADLKENYSEAIGWYSRALRLAREHNFTQFEQESLEYLAASNKATGNYEAALGYFEQFSSLSDSMHDLEAEKEFADLKSRLDLDRQTEINQLLEKKQEQQEKRLRIQVVLIFTAIVIIILILVILRNARNSNREIKLANERLRKQTEETDKLNKELQKLFAIISHDLRSPLASLKGMIDLFRYKTLSEEELEMFTANLENSIERNIDVLEDLFSWARDQMSGMELKKERVKIYPVIQQVIANIEDRATEKGVTIENKIGKSAELIGDSYGLTLIFRNLLSNAVKFTQQGDSITFFNRVEDGALEICVSDTGVGMSQETVESLFSDSGVSFSKLGTSGERGTGFGLSIIQDFVNKQGGTITVKSEEGKGSEFCIRLPR